jgi:hypothetical protein
VRLRGLGAGALAVLALAAAPAARAALPQIDYTLTGPAGSAGWFTGPVTLKWTLSGETASDAGCLTRQLTSDTPGVQVTCTASNADGTVPATTKSIKIDATPPAGLTAVPARPPDVAPWFTAPVAIAWSGADATSGIASCTTMTYAGPDGPAAAPAGTCRDVAGNVSAPLGFGLAYDATPPGLADLAASVADRTAAVHWTPAADAQQVNVVRRPGDAGAAARTVLDGPATTHEVADGPLTPGTTYTWTATLRDAAGNATAASTTATVAPPAQASATATGTSAKGPGRTAAGEVILRWRSRPGAKYYNIQLFRGSHKILSSWPTRTRYVLRTRWRFGGRTQRLSPGRYRWYVWPGYGRRTRHRYGRLLAHGRVAVPRATQEP